MKDHFGLFPRFTKMYSIRTAGILNQFWHSYVTVKPWPKMYPELKTALRVAKGYANATNRVLEVVEFVVGEPTINGVVSRER
jgi:hypothetical protein